MQRAKAIINNCAHPAYRDYLLNYLEKSRVGHIRHNLRECFELHRNFIEHGAMLPDLDLVRNELELKQFGFDHMKEKTDVNRGCVSRPYS